MLVPRVILGASLSFTVFSAYEPSSGSPNVRSVTSRSHQLAFSFSLRIPSLSCISSVFEYRRSFLTTASYA